MGCGCCTTPTPPMQARCPGCGGAGEAVSHTTLLHQLRRPWRQSSSGAAYYFCASTDCDTVYFCTSGGQFNRDAVRQEVGQKSLNPDRLLCYCFDIRYCDLGDTQSLRDFVIAQTSDKLCACEQRNPSGKCCLRDFPKTEKPS